jgi:hypothetical protein
MLDLVVGRICRSTSVTPNVELLVYFTLMSRWMSYIYCCLHVDICLKLEPWNMCIFIRFNVCLVYTCIIGDLIFVALHKKKKREGVLCRTFAMYFFLTWPRCYPPLWGNKHVSSKKIRRRMWVRGLPLPSPKSPAIYCSCTSHTLFSISCNSHIQGIWYNSCRHFW